MDVADAITGSLVDELKQKFTRVSPKELNLNSADYNLLRQATPDFVLEHDQADLRRAQAWLEYNGEVFFDPRPGVQHVEIALAKGIIQDDPQWFTNTIQGRNGAMCGLPVVSVYPYHVQSVAQLKTILRQIPIPNGALLTGCGAIYRVADILATTPQKNSGIPGTKWWAPTSESCPHKLSAIGRTGR